MQVHSKQFEEGIWRVCRYLKDGKLEYIKMVPHSMNWWKPYSKCISSIIPRGWISMSHFATGVLQLSNLLPSSLLTDAKVVPPSPPIQSVHPQPKQQKLAEVSSHISQVCSCQSPAWYLMVGIRHSWSKDSAKKCKLLKGKIHSRHWNQVRLYLRM